MSSALILVARVASTVFIPVAALVLFDDGCMQGWRAMWQPCDGDAFDAEVNVAYTMATANGFDYTTPEINSPISLMSTAEVCGGTRFENIDAARCTRGVLGESRAWGLGSPCAAEVAAAISSVAAGAQISPIFASFLDLPRPSHTSPIDAVSCH